MKRYLKLYWGLLRMAAVSLLTYRANFINNAITSILWSFMTIFSMILLTSRTSSVFGWKTHELWLLTGVYNVLFGIIYGVFSYNFDEIADIVNKGELDGWLLKPINSQFSISLWKIGYASLPRVIIGIFYIVYLIILLKLRITFFTLLLFIAFSIFSILLMYALSFSIMTLLIWFTTLTNLSQLLPDLNNITKYPREMYQRSSVFFSLILFPLTLVVVVPTRVLLGKASINEMILLPIVSILLLSFSHFFWKFALKSYSSASG